MKTPSSERKCVICKHKHPVAFCPVFKSKHHQERRKIAWDLGLCFNRLKTNHQARNCPSVKRCLRERCRLPHHTLLHECHQQDSHVRLASNRSSSTQPSATPQENVRSSESESSPLPTIQFRVTSTKSVFNLNRKSCCKYSQYIFIVGETWLPHTLSLILEVIRL